MVIQGVTYLSDFEAKKAIMEMARRLEAKGWLVAGDGSMSVRVGPQAVWVTVAGADKAALTQDMLVRVDMNGKAMLSAKPKPLPEDLPIHLKIYQENENAQCVMHTYPACAAVMGMQGQTVQPAAFSPAVRALGRVQLLPAQNVDAQAQAVSLLCRTDKAVLLENDGCLTWGKTPADAAHLVEALDYYAAVTAKLGCACSPLLLLLFRNSCFFFRRFLMFFCHKCFYYNSILNVSQDTFFITLFTLFNNFIKFFIFRFRSKRLNCRKQTFAYIIHFSSIRHSLILKIKLQVHFVCFICYCTLLFLF